MPLDAVGLVVQPGAYEAFAPGPIETVGDAYAPLVRATYLVREGVGSGCDTVPDWRCSGAAVPRWEVVGRLDPWPLGESGPTTPTPTPTPEPPVEPAGQLVEAIPAEALVAALQADRAALVGRTYAVFGQVARDPGLECLDGSDPVACPGITFGDVGSLFVRIEPVGDVGPGPWDPDAAALFGVHAIRVTAEDQAGIGPVLEYLGPIEPAGPELGPTAWSVEALLATGVLSGPELYPIAGWLVRDAVHTCPSPVPSRGCPDAWITPERYQPIQPGGGSVAPVGAIPVQPDAYERFAPDPDADPPGVQPRFGTYLVQRVQLSCGPNTDCFPPEGWMIRERLAPLPAEPSPVEPPPVGLKTLASPELAKLLDGARLADLGGYVFVFDGRISPDPVVLCIAGSRPPECPPLILLPWNGRQTVLTWDPAAPPDWDLLQPVTGRFVLRITGDVLGSSETVVFRYLGRP
jgi:hypothetical protein